MKPWWKFWEKADQSGSSYIQMMLSIGTAYWSGRDFLAFSLEGFRDNPTVRSCIKHITDAALSCPIVMRDSDDTIIASHPLLDLLRTPNPKQDWSRFLTQVLAYRLIGGEGDVWALSLNPARPPKELWALRPDWLEANRVGGNYPKQWYYAPDDQLAITVDPLDLLVWADFNPLDRVRGMSPLFSAARAIDTLNEYAKANVATLQNGCQPAGMFVTDQNMSDSTFQRLKEMINDTYVGSQNTGKPFIGEGGLKYQPTGLSPREMEFIAGKTQAELDVCKVLSVPPQILGLPGSQTFANYEQARAAFYEDCVLPLLNSFLLELSYWLAPRYSLTPGQRLCVDIEAVAALEPRRAERNSTIDGLSSLTVNEKREAMGYEEVEFGDVVLVPSTDIPLEAAGLDAVTPPTGTPPANSPVPPEPTPPAKNRKRYM